MTPPKRPETHPIRPATTDDRRRRTLQRGLVAGLLIAAGLALSACTTDQVFDTSRYWGDRLTGATIDADPSQD